MKLDQQTLDEIATETYSGDTVLDALLQFRLDMTDEQSANELVENALDPDAEGREPCPSE